MLDDASLQQLLREAGRGETPPPHPPPDLADRVQRLGLRRRRRRRVLGGLSAVSVVLAGTFATVYYTSGPIPRPDQPVTNAAKPPEDVPTPLADEDVKRLRAEIAELAAEADARQRLVEEAIGRQRLRQQTARLEEHSRGPDPFELARVEIEKTAFLLVDHAQRQSPLSPVGHAAEEYHRVLEYFPHTNAARTAEHRLKQLNVQKGDL